MSISHLRKKVSDPVIKWYGKYERPISSLSLIGGFVFDALTLKRVDEVWENIWVLGHLVLVAVLMIFVNWVENDPGDEKNPYNKFMSNLMTQKTMLFRLLSTPEVDSH
jgi:hypothetical protein